MTLKHSILLLGGALLIAHVSQADTFTVTNVADTGTGSLRQAITNANAAAAGTSAAPHTITFNIPSSALTGSFGSKRAVIALSTPLPALTNSYVTIDGTTQTSSAAGDSNTGTLGTATTVGVDGLTVSPVNRPEVELSLTANSTNTAVLTIQGANCTVKSLAVHGAGDIGTAGTGSGLAGGTDRSIGAGIRLDTGSGGFLITQCIVGSSAVSYAYPNDGTQCAIYGISVGSGGGGGTISNSLVGFTGNSGIFIINNSSTAAITISGCQFNQNGYNVAGGDAITLGGSAAVQVGPVTISGNLFTAPNSSGVQLEIGSTSTTTITNNSLLSCGKGGGNVTTSLENSAICYIQRTGLKTGSTSDVISKNIIKNTDKSGIVVGYGQKTVQITQNQIYSNGQLSIDLIDNSGAYPGSTTSSAYGDGDGVTPNRNNSTTTGGTYAAVTSSSPDAGIDYPIFTTANIKGSTLTVAGYVGTANNGQATFSGATVEVYEAASGTNNTGPTIITTSGNSDGTTVQHGELRRYLGSFTVNSAGGFSGTITGVTNLTKGDVIAGIAWLSAKGTSEAGTQYTLTVTSVVTATDLTNAVLQNTAASTALSVSLTGATSASGGSIASYTITSLPSASSGTLYYNTGTTASPTLKPATVGQVLTAANAGTLYFDPATGYSGNAIVGYSATDNTGVTSDDNATVTIPINAPPLANNVTNSATIANTTTTKTAISALSGYDSDGTVASFTITSLPNSGTLYYNSGTTASPTYTQITATGYSVDFTRASYLSYVPASGFSGNAVFNYTATDNNSGVSAPATYTIPVSGTSSSTAANVAPTANNITNANIAADAGTTSLSSLSGTDTDGTIAGFTIKTLPDATGGTLYFNGDLAQVGTIVLANQANLLSYKPVKQGTYSFTYTATDNSNATNAESAAATFTIPVSAPLPVTLVRFEAQRSGSAATLAWETASETNSDYFAVESSTDGQIFGEIGRLASYGTTTQTHTYQLVDANLARYAAPVVYYRLRQVDIGGKTTYSPVRTLAVAAPTSEGLTAQAYPNPAHQASLQLAVYAPAAGPATLTVADALGRSVLARQLDLSAGTNSLTVAEAAQWSSGVYVLRLAQGTTSQTLKVIRD